jgi:diguanylate cyclase (GGDEF)-like protein
MAKLLAWLQSPGLYARVNDAFAHMLSRTRDEIEGKAVADIHPDQAADILSMMERGAEEGLGELSEPIILPVTPAVSLSCRLMCTPQGDHWLMVAEPIYQAGHYSLGDLNDTEQVPRLKTSLDYVISQARLDNEHIALVKLSVERFNWLQETLGEQAAEQVMSDVAERIQVGLRRYDTLYRIRNDRLLIQLRHVGCAEEALRVANRLNELLAYAVRVDRREIHLSTAVGIALAPLQANDAGELMGAVSQALKTAQRSQGAGVRLYDPTRQRKALTVDDFARLIKPDYEQMAIGFRPVYGVSSHRIEVAQLTPLFKGVPCLGSNESLLAPFFEGEGGWQTYLTWLFGQLELPLARLAQHTKFQGVVITLGAEIVELPGFVEFMAQRIHLPKSLRTHVIIEFDAIETRDHEGVLFDIEALGYRIALNRLSDYLPPIQQLKELEPSLLKLDAELVEDMVSNLARRRQLEKIADIAADLDIPLGAEGVQSAGLRMQLTHQGVSYMQGDYFGRLLSSEMLQEQLILENM